MFADAGETVSRQVPKKLEAYSMEYAEDFFSPTTMQMTRYLAPQKKWQCRTGS